MQVEVRYSTEFSSSATVINVTEIPSFAKRFKLLSVKPYEEPNMISDWLEQNRNPEIDKQVEKESEYLSKQRLEKYSERFDNDKSPIGNPETWGKRVLTEEDIFNQRDIDAVTDYINKEQQKQHLIDIMQKDEELGVYDEPKQETTLEEVLGSSMCQFSVIENKLAILYRNQVKIYDAVTKEQQSYSEEEVIQLVSDWTDYRMSEDTKSKVTFKKYLEQFKKK